MLGSLLRRFCDPKDIVVASTVALLLLILEAVLCGLIVVKATSSLPLHISFYHPMINEGTSSCITVSKTEAAFAVPGAAGALHRD